MKIAWVSVASVAIGVLMFALVPQVQDLFLEVKGDVRTGFVHWLTFYAAVTIAWMLPVYVSSRWILSRFAQDQGSAAVAHVEPVQQWVKWIVPPLLATACFGAVLLGQFMALHNAPTFASARTTPGQEGMFAVIDVWSQASDACAQKSLYFACMVLQGAPKVSSASATFASLTYGPEFVILCIYAVVATGIGWFVLRRWLLSRQPGRRRSAAIVAWWLVTSILVIPALMALLFVKEFSVREWTRELSLGHLMLLPAVTTAAVYLSWRALLPALTDGVTPIGQRLLRLIDADGATDGATSEAAVTTSLVNPIFRVLLLISIVLFVTPFVINPEDLTRFVFRAPLLPLLLGVLVAPITFLSYGSLRWRAPLVLLPVLVVIAVTTLLGDTYDVRTLSGSGQRDTLQRSIERWAEVNGCKLAARDTNGASDCPNPVIISAAGGASRSAFHVSGVIGKLLDDTADQVGNVDADRTAGAERDNRPARRSFAKQLFAISAVSGGSLAAVISYAALADSQRAQRATNGIGRPPCKEAILGVDSDWFAPSIYTDKAHDPGRPWRPHESWRGCLQHLVSGDFLSPVMMSLATSDTVYVHQARGDRAAVLERAWEKRYAEITGRQGKSWTLDDALTSVREDVLKTPGSWLPVLMLNGTSVTTGRRIVTSDIDTITKSDTSPATERLLRDAYDVHELFEQRASSRADGDGAAPVVDTRRCKNCDVRLSTAATMSARFPVISPHGNIRGRDGSIVDRVVDGGYFENFGAITATELSRELDRFGLRPLIIFINNEPTNSGIECIKKDSALRYPTAPQSIFMSTLMSPISAVTATRQARGTNAAVELCKWIAEEKRFAFVTVKVDEHNPGKELSMSWWLSKHVQKYLDDQIDHLDEPLTDPENRDAFGKIESASRQEALVATTAAQPAAK